YVSAEGGPDWQYEFRNEPKVRLLRDGDQFEIGRIRIRVSHTPGHTPEHIIFFVTDGAAADRPIAAVTGDFVFVGDVGRPDLLEKAAQIKGTMETAAGQLYHSLQQFKQQPDYLQIWPGHGAGSACGKGLSAIPHSTVGYERMFNWAFAAESEAEFVTGVLSGQPEPPKYFAEMKRINRAGPHVLGRLAQPPRLEANALPALLEQKQLVIDTRIAPRFAAEHIPGTINLPLDRSFSTWAGWLVPYDRDFYLIVDASRGDALTDVVKSLAMIGLDRVGGYFDTDVIAWWSGTGRSLDSVAQITAQDLAAKLGRGEVTVVDVRSQSEWDEGHIPGVTHIPLGYLTDRLAEVRDGKPIVVQCQSGSRSAIGAGLLQAHGLKDVINHAGGFAEWVRAGQPVEVPS
ncbi:MAG TPA: rhodanese-like domain-containing protein, partial [Longimicrobiales bacterium]|nr:rhodanese-like domain-containing protein [Longimicrobiales bacterium]